MNAIKYLGFAGLAAAGLFATQAFATTCPVNAVGTQTQGGPVCIAPVGSDGIGTGLQDKLGPSSGSNSIFSAGPGINPYTQQVQMPFWSVNGSSGSVSTILLQLAGNANHFTFGIFDPTNNANTLTIFSNGVTGNSALLNVFNNGGYSVNDGNNPQITFGTTNYFGFFLTTPDGHTFYSLPSFNGDDTAHMVAYQGNGTNMLKPYGNKPGGWWGANEYIQAWEDLPFGQSDLDYNDFLVMVESVHPVPEPATLGMFGLGVLLIGAAVGLNRRRRFNIG